ncbi:MAG: hypothetical protein NC123_13965 [Butyrivibrio sp.]|nr:hypothetical protein [Acetatifactor muris]MCM1560628.1 hypothetical protein [Butyrivibrio sp.]
MKLIKRILYFIVALLVACSLGILVCALNPSLTAALAEKVQQLQAGNAKPESGRENTFTPVVSGNGDGEKYVVPDSYPQEIPEGVGGLTGYQPITAENQQIAQEEADNLNSILAPGETGEGLSFSAEYYPYYAMLNDTLKTLYRQVYANAMVLNTSFTPAVAVTTAQAMNVVEAVYNDHPELFWLDAEFACKYLRTGICVEITLEYNETADDLAASVQDFNTCTSEILAGAMNLGSDYEKEQYIHDALVHIVEYSPSMPIDQSAYSAIVLGKSVCAGYARAFQYLMQQLGIPCYYCTGYAGEDHAWNIVKMGSLYRNVDVTWDDTDPSTYDYYNKSDREFGATHVRTDLAVYLPACADVPAVETTEPGSSAVDAYINPNPIEPPIWQSRGDSLDDGNSGKSEEEKQQENLEKAGITEEQVLRSLEKYYEDCKKRLEEAGTGEKQFVNIIPESLWNDVERAYSSGSYWNGYADEALKKLGVENFLIQLQVQRLGGGYCKLYHNIYTY